MVIEEIGSRGGQANGPQARRPQSRCSDARASGRLPFAPPIGSGGMGVVYEAIQESLGRHVALKMLPFHQLGDPTRLERFRREARAAARLHHTHIVPVFGVGEHDGLHYYIMQFIQGHGLDTVLREVKRLRREPGALAALDTGIDRASSTDPGLGLCTGRFPADGMGRVGHSSPPSTRRRPRPRTASSASPSLSLVPNDRSELSNQPEAQYFRSVARIGVQVAEALEYAHGRASSTATSSPPTSCSTPRDKSGSPTSVWPRPRTATS